MTKNEYNVLNECFMRRYRLPYNKDYKDFTETQNAIYPQEVDFFKYMQILYDL